MKNYLIAFSVMLFCFMSFGQDVINFKDKTSVKAKVLNVGVKTILYKKYDNLNGPSYEIRTRDVTNVLYENGTQEVIKTKSKEYNESKNVISFNYGDLTVSRLGFSYERLFAKSKLGIKIPISASFIGNNNYYNEHVKMQTGLDVNYYPLGQKTVAFYTGLSTRIGKVSSYNHYYDPFYYDYTYAYYNRESNFISAYVNNGLVLHFNDNFSISGQVGVGIRNIYQNHQSTNPHVNGELNASFRF